jgi:Na+-driven multidrug efflux pump
MSREKRLINSGIAAIICSVLTSIVVFFLPNFTIPPFTGDGTIDTIIFLVGEFLLWFILWYLVLSMREKFKRALDPNWEIANK